MAAKKTTKTTKKAPAKKATRKKAPKKVEPKPKLAPVEQDFLGEIRTKCGDDQAFLLGSDDQALKIRGVIPTGAETVNVAIGRGGWPLGRLSIIVGGEGGGKTTLALSAVANCQRAGGLAIYIDKEHKLDPDWAALIGVDTDKMIISQPGSLEDVVALMEIVVAKVRARRIASGKRIPVILVLDSINASKAQCVIDGDVTDSHYAPEARVWSSHLSHIVQEASVEDVALMFISQTRTNIGVMFGPKESIAGGAAPKFHASVIANVRRTAKVKSKEKGKEDEPIGTIVQAEFVKNQIAPPFRKGLFHIKFDRGIDYEMSVLEAAEAKEIIFKSGAYLKIDGEDGEETIGQGYEQAAAKLRKDKELCRWLADEIRAEMGWSK